MLKTNGNSRGVGVSSRTPWKGNYWGVGDENQKILRGGMDIFWNHTILQKLHRTSASCSAAAAVGVTCSVENVLVSLIDSVF